MKDSQKQLKRTAVLLSILIVLQGCRIYHSESLTIQKTAVIHKTVKVILMTQITLYLQTKSFCIKEKISG